MLLRFYALWHKQPCCTVVIDGAQFELSIRLALYRVCLRSESVHVGCLSTCPRVLIQKTCSNRGMGNFTINLISQNLEFHWIHFSWSKYSKTSLKWFVLRILNWTLRPYLISEIVFLDSALLAVCLSILVERNSHYFLSLHSEVRIYSGQVIRYTWGIKDALLPSNVEVHDMEIALWIFYWNTFFFSSASGNIEVCIKLTFALTVWFLKLYESYEPLKFFRTPLPFASGSCGCVPAVECYIFFAFWLLISGESFMHFSLIVYLMSK